MVVTVPVKQVPLLARIWSVAFVSFDSCSVRPVGISSCPFEPLFFALNWTLPFVGAPAFNCSCSTPSDDSVLSVYLKVVGPLAFQQGFVPQVCCVRGMS